MCGATARCLQAGGRRLLKDEKEKENKPKKEEGGEKKKKAAVGGRKKQEARPPLEPGQKMYMVVGFEVVACSIRREPGEAINKNLMCPQSLDDPNGPTPQEVKKGGWVAGWLGAWGAGGAVCLWGRVFGVRFWGNMCVRVFMAHPCLPPPCPRAACLPGRRDHRLHLRRVLGHL